jgi:hypothetical protein
LTHSILGSISAILLVALAFAFHHGALCDGISTSHGLDRKMSRARELKQKPSRLPAMPTIDPVLVYSTYLGGPNSAGPGTPSQGALASVVDGPGNVIVVGQTNSQNFPTTTGVIQPTNSPSTGAFLTKINPTGQSLVFSTYLNLDRAPVMAVDASGNIFVGGTSSTFQIPAGLTPYQSTPKSNLILKLNSTATTLLGASYVGSSRGDTLYGLAVDTDGNLYASGDTTANDFPTTPNAYQPSIGSSGHSSFLVKLDSTLSNLLYATYLGQDSSRGQLAVDSSKNAYIVGQASDGFPVTSGALQSTCSSVCGTLAKLNPSGSGSGSLLYATYIGGTGATTPAAVAVDGSQNVYISGFTGPGFPEVKSIQSCAPSAPPGLVVNYSKGFVAEVNAAGSLAFSSCLGTNTLTDVVVDGAGTVYVTGTADVTLPLTNPIEAITGPENAPFGFVAAINPSSGSLLFSSFLSGPTYQGAQFNTIGVDSSGDIVVAGTALDVSFPVFNAFQPSRSPGTCTDAQIPNCTVADGVIAKISPTAGAAAALAPASLTFAAQGVGTSASQTVTMTDMGSDALTVSSVVASGDFTVQGACTTVAAAGGSCPLQVTFTPTALGNRTGTLTITDSSAGSPHTVALLGVGGAAGATASPTSLTFASQQPNTTSAQQQVTLANNGAISLQILNVNITGPFAETNTCGASVPAGQSCVIQVTFTPTVAGSATGTLSVTDSASNSPQTIPLTGTGGTPKLGLMVGPNSSLTATLNQGFATYILQIGGQGIGGSGTATCSGAPAGINCSVPPLGPVSATSPSLINIGVSTTTHSHSLPMRWVGPVPWQWALAILACVIMSGIALTVPSRRMRCGLVPLLGVVLCACGGGPASTETGPQSGTYTLVVTAKVGSNTENLNLKLIVP